MSKTTNNFFRRKFASWRSGWFRVYQVDYPSRWAAVIFIAEKIGCVPQTLHAWVRKAEIDSGKQTGVPTETAEKLKALERESRELRQVNEILRKASAYFPRRSSTARSSADRLYR